MVKRILEMLIDDAGFPNFTVPEQNYFIGSLHYQISINQLALFL